MELTDAAMFWEMHFGKVMGHDEFVKKYLYNIQHMYGKVGGRKSYTPYSCNKVTLCNMPSAIEAWQHTIDYYHHH